MESHQKLKKIKQYLKSGDNYNKEHDTKVRIRNWSCWILDKVLALINSKQGKVFSY